MRPFFLLSLASAGFAGCVFEKNQNAAPPVSQFAEEIKMELPRGWSALLTNNVVVVQKAKPVYLMGYVSRRGMFPDMTEDEYFKQFGSEVQYEIRLKFVPRLSDRALSRLKSKQEAVRKNFDKKEKM